MTSDGLRGDVVELGGGSDDSFPATLFAKMPRMALPTTLTLPSDRRSASSLVWSEKAIGALSRLRTATPERHGGGREVNHTGVIIAGCEVIHRKGQL